ncbi:MAG TPA: hypothetical protein VFE30_15125 [Anaeromyxobacteraceae bacterium]|nr:hypothetical protein [Anaeromyxobacteraceae bacterium]
MNVTALAAALALLVAAAPARAADDLSHLLRRSVEVYGGAKALAKVGAVKQTGRVTAVMRGNAEGRLVRLYAAPRNLRVDIAYPDGNGESRVLQGERGWRQGQPAQGMQLAAMVLQAARLELPRVFFQDPEKVADAGVVERNGKKLRAVAVDLGGGLALSAEIDPETGYILHTSGGGPIAGGMRIAFETDYSDFRKVNGILFAFHEDNFANGVHTGETFLDKVELLRAPPPAHTFKPGARPESI